MRANSRSSELVILMLLRLLAMILITIVLFNSLRQPLIIWLCVPLAGLTSPEHLQGVSLRPLLGHPERLGKKKYAYSVVSRGSRMGYTLRNQRWRYGKWPDGEELYNLTNDPQEKKNLARQPRFAERLAEFRELLAARQKAAAARR